LNSAGDIVWDKTYGYEHSDQFNGVVQTPDGGFIATGNSITVFTDIDQYTDAYIVRTDADGNEVWSHLYGDYYNDSLGKVRVTKDGGYVSVGGTSSYSKSGDIYFLKFNGTGLISGVKNITADNVPEKFELGQNYPNPFNPTTKISFAVPQSSNGMQVTLKVYNIIGQEISTLVNKRLSSGMYEVNFNGENLSSGTYIYTIKAGNFYSSRKMMLIK